MATRDELDQYMASKSDAWLQVELDQAVAAMNDKANSCEFRESAMAAAYLMASELERRNGAA